MTSLIFDNALAPVSLQCWPDDTDPRLQPWDGADRLTLELLSQRMDAGGIFVLNERYGAVSTAIHVSVGRVTSGGDSWLARQALAHNLTLNDRSTESLVWLWPAELASSATLVILRQPTSLALLRFQLARLAATLPAGTPVWIAAMDKHCPRNFRQWLSASLEQVRQFPGRYKAHVYHGVLPAMAADTLEQHFSEYSVPGLPRPLRAYAGVFAQQQLDIGARQLLAHLPEHWSGELVDLGCGAGTLGLVAAARNPSASIGLYDESHQAIRSASFNAEALFPQRRIECVQGDGVCGRRGDADMVLLNPPFHRGHAVDASAGYALVEQAALALKPGGELRMVVNRHLDYRAVLRRYFSAVSVLGGNPKFVVFQALR